MSSLDAFNAARTRRAPVDTAAVRMPFVAALAVIAGASAACATAAPRAAGTVAAFAEADSTASTSVAPGVTHSFVRDARGPWAFHVVEVDARRCEPVLATMKPGTVLGERARTSDLARDALAGINADFFMLPGGTPVGAHVRDGVPLIGPTDRPVFAVTAEGWAIGIAGINGHAFVHADSAVIAQVNRPARAFSAYRGTRSGLTLFTARIGDAVAPDSAAHRLHMRLLDGDEAAGRAVIVAIGSAVDTARMQPGSAILLAHGEAREWAGRRAAGDTVVWRLQVIVGAPAAVAAGASVSGAISAPLLEAVGGFPELIRDGRPVLAGQTVAASFGNARHPRTAIGWTSDRRLLLVVVDGRQPNWSAGMSLDELTWLFQRLGTSHALNLDGGGSTAMVVNGAIVNRPSDREGERAVGNALALVGCR